MGSLIRQCAACLAVQLGFIAVETRLCTVARPFMAVSHNDQSHTKQARATETDPATACMHMRMLAGR